SSVSTAELKRRVVAAYLKGTDAEDADLDDPDGWIPLLEGEGIEYKKTPKGELSTAAEVITQLAPEDEILRVYQARQKLQKIVTTEMPRLLAADGTLAGRVHPAFRTIVETGRTSSYANGKYPSLNGQNV